MSKFTTDQAITNEAEALADALCSNCLELNDEFLNRHFSTEAADILKKLPCEKERAFVLDSHLKDDNWRTLSGYDEGADINIPIGEIEIQFDSSPEEFFADPSDWTINGNLAYTTLDGICWTLDLKELQADVSDLLESE